MIIPMERKHTFEVGELHHRYIRSLLRDLGKRVCIVFYDNALRSDINFGYVYVEDSKVLGFTFGTEDNSQVFKSPRIRLEILLSLLRRPYLMKRLFAHLKNQSPPSAERLYAAVDTNCRHKGIAMKLYAAQNQGFKERGITYFEDSVDVDNISALTLLRFLGAKIKHEFVESGVRRYRLYTHLSL
jgi:ribosomal protein S18 acetylase RimI-like enzyme